MSCNINTVVLGGNLVRDPEVSYTPKGTAVLDISIANNEVWTDDAGEKHEEVTFVEVRFWGKQAENGGRLCHKGKPIVVEGRLSQQRWEDKETGKARSKTLIKASKFHFAGDSGGGRRPINEEPPPDHPAARRPAPAPPRRTGHQFGPQPTTPPPRVDDGPIMDGLDGDDIPF